MSQKLFSEAKIGNITLQNHIVMAPMTRSRNVDNAPNELVALYYAQRATAGLIVTEGTSPSPNGTGYVRIPGIYTDKQIAGWKLVTEEVHKKGAKIFLQIMHTGRVSNLLNMQEGAEIVSSSATPLSGEIYTDSEGMKPYGTPRALTESEIETVIQEYVTASKNAITAGFDGVELHGANGYLIEQFIAPNVNNRTDKFGGSIENRSRFLLEIAKSVSSAIGKDKVGVRLSPYGVFNDIEHYSEINETYEYISGQLNELGIAYIHLVDHSYMGAPAVQPIVVQKVREKFKNTLILSGGYDVERGEKDLQSGSADLIAFGRPYISNPDLVERLKTGAELNSPDFSTFYTPGEKGFTDYPFLS